MKCPVTKKYRNKTENYSVSMPSPRYFSQIWEVNRGDFDHYCIQNIQQYSNYSKVLTSTQKYQKVHKSTKKYQKVLKSTQKTQIYLRVLEFMAAQRVETWTQ